MLRFKEVHGHTRVPRIFPEDPVLGRWVHRQRRAYAAELDRAAGRKPKCIARINPDRIKTLMRIGFEWKLVTKDWWDERFAALRRFVKEFGHARVPRTYEGDPVLGRWVHTQRNAYVAEQERKAGRHVTCKARITDARIEKLRRIGFEWTVEYGRGRKRKHDAECDAERDAEGEWRPP